MDQVIEELPTPQLKYRSVHLRQYVMPVLLTLILPLIVLQSLTPQKKQEKPAVLAQTTAVPLPIKVLVLEYFPLSASNTANLDGVETGWGSDATVNGRTVKFWEQATTDMITSAVPVLNEGSRYHGYKDPTAIAFLNYQVIDTRKFYTPIPRGVALDTQPDGTVSRRPYYSQILTNVNTCNYVNNLGVQEVWMYGYHSKYIVPDESRMSSKYGDISNSYPKEETLATQYKMPRCAKAYTLYNFTYQPGGGAAMGNTIHNRIHQIENMIPFAEGKYPPSSTTIPGSTFWGDFSEYVQDTTSRASYRSSCGNAHYPPNWQNAKTDAYRYDLKTLGRFNCETWNPDDTKTTYITAGCERWGCTDVGFYKYFMQNIPGYNNGIVFNGQPMKNWWEIFYDFEAFIDHGRSLYGTSIIPGQTASPTPTRAVTPTPIPTVKPSPTKIPTPTPTRKPSPTPTKRPTPTPRITKAPSPTPTPKFGLSIKVSSPAANTIVKKSGVITLVASTTSSLGVAKVEFYGNKKLLCSTTASPYKCRWKAPAVSTVTTISANVYDKKGNTVASTGVRLTTK